MNAYYEAPKNNTYHVTLEDGFEVDVKLSAFNDYELLEALVDAETEDSNQLIGIIKAIKKLFSPEEKKRLLDHLRNEEGVVTAEAMMETIGRVFSAMNDSQAKKQ